MRVGVSENRGPEYNTLNSRILTIRALNKVPLFSETPVCVRMMADSSGRSSHASRVADALASSGRNKRATDLEDSFKGSFKGTRTMFYNWAPLKVLGGYLN